MRHDFLADGVSTADNELRGCHARTVEERVLENDPRFHVRKAAVGADAGAEARIILFRGVAGGNTNARRRCREVRVAERSHRDRDLGLDLELARVKLDPSFDLREPLVRISEETSGLCGLA